MGNKQISKATVWSLLTGEVPSALGYKDDYAHAMNKNKKAESWKLPKIHLNTTEVKKVKLSKKKVKPKSFSQKPLFYTSSKKKLCILSYG